MLEIRKADVEDAEELLEYCKATGGESDNLSFGAEGLPVSVEQEKDWLKGMSESEKQVFLVAKEDGRIVGTAALSGFAKPRMDHRGEIAISVRKAMWGRRIGTRLMEELIRWAGQFDLEIISLEVRSDNERAIRLYRKFGFETFGTFRGFMKINGELITYDLMCLHLPEKTEEEKR